MRARAVCCAPLIVGFALLAAACGDNSSSTDSASESQAAATSAASSESGTGGTGTEDSLARRGYLAALKAGGVKYDSDDDAVEAGREVCEELGEGKSRDEVVKDIDEDRDDDRGNRVVVAATTAFCPDRLGAVMPSLPDASDLPTLPSIKVGE
ncbi:DUF732 domain-containing protein [Gordonia zhaorongruii]|uniref:DUF732 domain-containing protein n=1 Tax=Gordonia zhaorongruii TaxID=2597659 RepID=UPI00104E7C21|nr:DUF732 domain-containing protein [Gordonia zhaorongruii]